MTPSRHGESSRTGISRPEFIALIAALMSLNALAIDVMLPALPAIGTSFQIANPNDRPLILSAYMLGLGAATLLFGPVTDRFGRRPPLFAGIAIYVGSTLLVPLAPSFLAVLVLRMTQGMGAAAFRVVVLAVVRDKYEGRTMAQIMSLAFMMLMLVPILAPGIGQTLLLIGPWQGIFLFVGLGGTLTGIWAFFRLAETLAPENRRPISAGAIVEGFRVVFTNRFSMLYAIAGMLVFGTLMGMINSAQQIFVDHYQLGPLFPLAFAGMASFMALASFLNSRTVQKVGMRRIVHAALLLFITSSALLSLLSQLVDVPLWLFLVLQTINLFTFGWTSANMNALSMEPLGRVAGTAASAFGFFQTIGGALIGLAISRAYDGSITPIAFGYLIVGLSALAMVLWAEKGRLFGVGTEPG